MAWYTRLPIVVILFGLFAAVFSSCGESGSSIAQDSEKARQIRSKRTESFSRDLFYADPIGFVEGFVTGSVERESRMPRFVRCHPYDDEGGYYVFDCGVVIFGEESRGTQTFTVSVNRSSWTAFLKEELDPEDRELPLDYD